MAASGSRRDELVQVAARLFAERGYHGTSMADLAAAMGVQKGSLYSHIAYARQLAIKSDVIRDAFGRLGRYPIDRPIDVATRAFL